MLRRLREEANAKNAVSRQAGVSNSTFAAPTYSSPSSVSTIQKQSQQLSPLPSSISTDRSLSKKQDQDQENWRNESLCERKIMIEGGVGRGRGRVISLLEDPMGTFAGGNGATLWDCSLALTRFLAAHYTNDYFIMAKAKIGTKYASTDRRAGKTNVLELGAGLGLVGIALATMGANVVVTERALALPLLARNIENNQGIVGKRKTMDSRSIADGPGGGAIEVAELSWGKDTTTAFLDDLDRRGRPPFDIVVGSDLIFPSNVDAYPLLVDSLDVILRRRRRHHNHEIGTNRSSPVDIWLSHEPRRPDVERKFWKLLEDRGINVFRLTMDATNKDCAVGRLPSDHPEDILILKLSLKD